MKNQNIVMLCQQSWDVAIDTNARNLAYELAKQNNVLYVSMPLDVSTVLRRYREPAIKTRLRQLVSSHKPRQAADRLWVFAPNVLGLSINWLNSRWLFRVLNRLNSKLLARSINRAVRAVGFTDYYLFQDGLIFQGLELPQLLHPKRFIYYLRDYMIAVPYFRRHGPWAEQRLLREADVVVTNSSYLNDYASRYTPRSYNIGQGCVLTRYQADVVHPEPADLAGVGHPRLVYTGNLTALRLDLHLLQQLARQRPSWQLVLVGPEDEAFAASPLHQLPNVHFPGKKAPEELAAYLQHADVCINPQLVNDITIGNYPLKIDEYLAMGKPVVATHTQAMEMFAQHVYLATDADHWLHLLDQALHEGGPSAPDQRIAFAQSHTWQASAQALYQALSPSQPAVVSSHS
jgi:teichuronic acid biosynthesis glycosyltransferase TuaH